jgi:hypothetical protein
MRKYYALYANEQVKSDPLVSVPECYHCDWNDFYQPINVHSYMRHYTPPHWVYSLKAEH